jgi:hypothetical protein
MSDLSVTLPMQLMGRILHGYHNCKRSMETSLLLRGDVHTSDLFVTRRMQLMGRILGTIIARHGNGMKMII